MFDVPSPIVILNDDEVPIITVSDRTWNDNTVAATLYLNLPKDVTYKRFMKVINILFYCLLEKL